MYSAKLFEWSRYNWIHSDVTVKHNEPNTLLDDTIGLYWSPSIVSNILAKIFNIQNFFYMQEREHT